MTMERWPLPLPLVPAEIAPAIASLLNAAAGRDPAVITVCGQPVSVSLTPPMPLKPGAMRLALSIGGEAASLALPAELLRVKADGAVSALLLEAALADVLASIERQLGAPLALHDLRRDDGAAAEGVGLRLLLAGREFCGLVELGPTALSMLTAQIDVSRRAPAAAVPVQLCVRAGVTEVAYADLMTLAPGDALLMQETQLNEGRVTIVVGERLATVATRVPGGVALDARPGPANSNFIRRWCMTDDIGDLVDADLTELRVTLVFELGRRMATLAEVSAFGPGSVVETGGGPEQSVDVLANGQRIGRGTIVTVGGALAVQLHRIHAKGTPS